MRSRLQILFKVLSAFIIIFFIVLNFGNVNFMDYYYQLYIFYTTVFINILVLFYLKYSNPNSRSLQSEDKYYLITSIILLINTNWIFFDIFDSISSGYDIDIEFIKSIFRYWLMIPQSIFTSFFILWIVLFSKHYTKPKIFVVLTFLVLSDTILMLFYYYKNVFPY